MVLQVALPSWVWMLAKAACQVVTWLGWFFSVTGLFAVQLHLHIVSVPPQRNSGPWCVWSPGH